MSLKIWFLNTKEKQNLERHVENVDGNGDEDEERIEDEAAAQRVRLAQNESANQEEHGRRNHTGQHGWNDPRQRNHTDLEPGKVEQDGKKPKHRVKKSSKKIATKKKKKKNRE